MSLRAIPLMIIPFVLYFALVLVGVDLSASLTGEEGLTLLSGGQWRFTWGDLLLLITFVVLFAEILKATYTSTASLLDHGLSMLVFVACLVCFLTVGQAATSVFFLIMMAALIDVIAGYTIGIRVARRDIGFGGMGQ
jgi:hypothetical protein